MTKALRFAKLDLITIKPFLKGRSVFIFGFVSLALLLGTNTSGGAIGYFMILSMLFSSYPFAVGEQNGIDTLYSTLSVNRDTVVLGRYIFATLLTLCSGLMILAVIVILSPITKGLDLGEAAGSVAACFSIFSLVLFFQLPVYFKAGYTKAKVMVYVPLIILLLVGAAGSFLFGQGNLFAFIEAVFSFLTANKMLAVIIGLAVYALCFTASLTIAKGFYRKRDF